MLKKLLLNFFNHKLSDLGIVIDNVVYFGTAPIAARSLRLTVTVLYAKSSGDMFFKK